MLKIATDSKAKNLPKPIVSSRLPKAFSQPIKKMKKKDFEEISEAEEYKKMKNLLSPIKVMPTEHAKLTKALKQLEKLPGKQENNDLYEPFSKVRNQGQIILPQCQVQLEEMITLSSLNSQSLNGNIRKVLHAQSLELFAIKQIPISTRDERAHLRDWIGKWQNAQQRHKKLLKVSATFWNSPEGVVSVVMEYLPGGSLKNLIDTCGSLPEQQVSFIAKKVLECLKYFHGKGETYGGISTSQVLFTKSGSIKFGLGLTQRLRTKIPSVAADIYSIGLLVLNSVIGDSDLIPSTTNECCAFHSIEANPMVNRLTPQIKDFLCLCLNENSNKRPTAQELLKHEWLNLENYPGPSVELKDVIAINYSFGSGEYLEAADKLLVRVCEALKVVILGQHLSKPGDIAIQQLATDLGLPYTTVNEKISKVYTENF